MAITEKTFGIMAHFTEPAAVMKAAHTIHRAGYKNWDVHTPFPVHGLDQAMGIRRSKVPYFTLLCGMCGTCLGYLMIWFMNSHDYPLVVGGKPFFSFIYPFPVAYEATILLAAFGTFFGMFITNGLPRHYHPTFNYEGFKKVSDDQFFVVIEATDPEFNESKTKELLQSLGGKEITLVDQ